MVFCVYWFQINAQLWVAARLKGPFIADPSSSLNCWAPVDHTDQQRTVGPIFYFIKRESMTKTKSTS